MNEKFNILVKRMPERLKEIKNKPLLAKDELWGIPQKGVYVFYENNKALYVGRSNNLKLRIQQHGRKSSTHNQAQLAFNIANKVMEQGTKIPRYITRKQKEKAPGFDRAFFEA